MTTSNPAQKVKNWMKDNYTQHIDFSCDVLNATTLAEDAAAEFDLYVGYYDIPEEVFEWAAEIEDILLERGIVQR